MNTEIKEYQVQYLGGTGNWTAIDHVSDTKEKAFEKLGYYRGRHMNDTWRLAEVTPLLEPAEISGWQVCYKDNEVWVPTSWTYNYGSVEEAREALSHYVRTPGNDYAIFKVSGVQEQ